MNHMWTTRSHSESDSWRLNLVPDWTQRICCWRLGSRYQGPSRGFGGISDSECCGWSVFSSCDWQLTCPLTQHHVGSSPSSPPPPPTLNKKVGQTIAFFLNQSTTSWVKCPFCPWELHYSSDRASPSLPPPSWTLNPPVSLPPCKAACWGHLHKNEIWLYSDLARVCQPVPLLWPHPDWNIPLQPVLQIIIMWKIKQIRK